MADDKEQYVHRPNTKGGSPTRAYPAFSSDEVLISRLRALGYSIALPEVADAGETSEEEDRTEVWIRTQANRGQPDSRTTLLDRFLASTRDEIVSESLE